MLVLSRKEGQRIVLDNRIEIVITQVLGNRVRVGISAPPEISIRRGELENSAESTHAEPALSLAS